MNIYKDYNIIREIYPNTMSSKNTKKTQEEPKTVEKVLDKQEKQVKQTKQVKQEEPKSDNQTKTKHVVEDVKHEQVVEQPNETKETEPLDPAFVRFETYTSLYNNLETMQKDLTMMKNQLKSFFKTTEKSLKKANKNKRKHSGTRAATGFGVPSPVPKSLHALFAVDDTVMMTRPDVTKRLYKYIKDNKLTDTKDSRVLRVDGSLADALLLSKDEMNHVNTSSDPHDEKGLSFYNLQKHIARLYPKAEKKAEVKEVKEVKDVKEHEPVVKTKSKSKQ